MPKISVITPIYKTEKYLDKCLKSLVNQSLNDLEFIWVDNGASELCRQIMAEYEFRRPNIKVIHLHDNIGYSGAMNLGLEKATGDFVAFCDSDDMVDEDYYEKLYSNADKNTEVVYCEYLLEYENGSKKYVHLLRKVLSNCRGALLQALPAGAIWNAIFNTKFIKNNNIHFSLSKNSVYKDNYFSVQVAWLAKNIKLVENVYYNYIQHYGSTVTGLSRRVEIAATSELIKEISSFDIFKNPTLEETEVLTDFLMRSVPWIPPEKIPLDSFFYNCYAEKYKRYKAFSYPSFLQRMFSISEHFSKPYKKIRLLGFSFKFKQKKGTL